MGIFNSTDYSKKQNVSQFVVPLVFRTIPIIGTTADIDQNDMNCNLFSKFCFSCLML